jgi:hypothetical protein
MTPLNHSRRKTMEIILTDGERIAANKAALKGLDQEDRDTIKAYAMEMVEKVKEINPTVFFSENAALEVLAAIGREINLKQGPVRG